MRAQATLLVLAACLLQLAQANPIPQEQQPVDSFGAPSHGKSPKECIDSFRTRVATLEVPADVRHFVAEVKKLNAPVYSQVNSLIKLTSDTRLERDVYETGIVSGQQASSLVESCGSFVAKLLEASDFEGCTPVSELDESEFDEYSRIMSGISELDEVFGAASVCYML